MNGRKISTNQKRLFLIVCLIWAGWTCFFVLGITYKILEIDAERNKPSDRTLIYGETSKSEVLFLGIVGWGLGLGVIGGGGMLFWRSRYQIDYKGNVIEVFQSWPRKQLFVNGELQDENTDFAFTRVELHGRIKSGEATGISIRISFESFGSLTPICVVIDNSCGLQRLSQIGRK